MAKRYFWLKIHEGFFKKKEIKILRKMDNGSTYVIIYEKMLLAALENNNVLYFDHLQNSFEEEMSVLLDEEVEDVKVTVNFLKKANLLKCENEDEYILTEMENLTGKESDSKERVKKHRENKKNLKAKEKTSETIYNEEKSSEDNCNSEEKSSNVTCNSEENSCNVTCNENVTLDIEKEKDLDKESQLEKSKDSSKLSDSSLEKISSDTCDKNSSVSQADENLAKIIKLYEENIGVVYPVDREYFIEISSKIHWTLFKKALQICIDKNKVNAAYLRGIIKRWNEEKICTLDQWKKNEEEFLSKKQSFDKTSSKSDESKNKSAKDKFTKDKSNKNKTKCEEIDENMLKEIASMEEKLGVS